MGLTPIMSPVSVAEARNQATAERIAEMLHEQLGIRRPALARYERYYKGEHRQLYDTDKVKTEFQKQVRDLCVNFPRLIVNSMADRMAVKAWLAGMAADADGNGANDDRWKFWVNARMPAREQKGYRWAMALGEAPILVHDRGWSIEHPAQTIVAVDPETGEVTAALKEWSVGSGAATKSFVTLWLPGATWRFRRAATASEGGVHLPAGAQGGPFYFPREAGQEVLEERNDLGRVPLARLVNDEDLLGAGTSDLEVAIPLVDLINKLLRDLTVSSDFNALPQRWVAGIETKDSKGNKIPVEKMLESTKRLLNLGHKDAKMGQLDASDGKFYVDAIHLAQQMLAAITSTPHDFFEQSQNPPSSDSVEARQAGHLLRTRSKQVVFADGLMDAMNIQMGTPDFSASPVWRQVERRTLAERADAFSKFRMQNGLSLESTLAEALDWTPEQIGRELQLLNFPDRRVAAPTAKDDANPDNGSAGPTSDEG